MQPQEASWLACAIDSEGSIVRDFGHRRQPQVRFYNTNRDFVERFAELVNGKISVNFRNMNHGHLPIYYCYVPGKANMIRILEEVMPYLIVKKLRAAEALDWLKRPVSGNKGGRPYSPFLQQLFALYDMEASH